MINTIVTYLVLCISLGIKNEQITLFFGIVRLSLPS